MVFIKPRVDNRGGLAKVLLEGFFTLLVIGIIKNINKKESFSINENGSRIVIKPVYDKAFEKYTGQSGDLNMSNKEFYAQEHNMFYRVKNDLAQRGYPQQQVLFEKRLASDFIPDIVVFDRTLQTPILIIECKANYQYQNLSRSISALQSKANKLSQNIPIYLAICINEELYYFAITDNFEKVRNIQYLINNRIGDIIPNYESLAKYEPAINRAKCKEKRKKVFTNLSVWCIISAIITGILLILDLCTVITFNYCRLILLGAVIVLFLLPQFSKIRIGDIEISNDKK